jgi:signal transduction histidine kinase/CheY-like chemotaxis protein
MANVQQQAEAAGVQEVARLVGKAREVGQADAFLGKRRWVRYQLGLRLEVTTGGSAPSDTWPAVMHNVSGGGFGFWSKRKLEKGDCIFIREWLETKSGEWLPAWVTHCTTGIQGHLVGARFEYSCSPEEFPFEDGALEGDSPDAETVGRHGKDRPKRYSIRTRCMIAAVASSSAGALTAAWSAWMWANSGENAAFFALAFLGVCGLAGVIGWRLVAPEIQFLMALRSAIRDVARDNADPSLVVEAPSQELDSLRRAVLSLGARWRKREDDERAQRQKLEEVTQIKSNILSIVSHDLRTPLTSILLYTQMLREELGALSVEDQSKFLGIIADECNRLSRLVDDLLEVQRLESDRVRWDMKPQDLTETIRTCARVFEALANSKSIELVVACPDSLPPAQADADKIAQVLSNLMSNAMKYTPSGGKVQLSAEARGGEILLRVADSGPGIPRDKWDQIFDRFSQLADPNVAEIDGFGLGLYIVKRIVERHGGAAWVDSGIGRGSEFWVSLPTQESEIKTEQENPRTESAGRILVCDPDPALAAMVSQTLRWQGYDVRICHSAARLLSQLTHGDIDIVVTDVLLPDMDAAELLDALHNLPNKSFRLIVHSYAGEGGDGGPSGVDMFLQRPVSKVVLIDAIEVVMQKRSGTRSSVLLVEGGKLDIVKVSGLLSSSGYSIVVAPDLDDAVRRLRDFSIDALMVPERLLGPNWTKLQRLWEVAGESASIVVISEVVRKRERKLAEDYHVKVVAYSPGSEDSVVSSLSQSETTSLVESRT